MIKTLIIKVTTRCDLNCAHCVLDEAGDSKDLPLDVFAKILREAKPFGANIASFTGGEPRLHPQFDELIGIAVEYGYTWNLVSNGQDVNSLLKILEKYVDSCRGIFLSFDGVTSDVHDGLRRKRGAFNKLQETVEVLKKAGCTINTNTCLSRENLDQLDALVSLGKEWGIKKMKFAGYIPNVADDPLQISDAERLEIYKQIQILDKNSPVELRSTSALHTRGGVDFCGALNLNALSFNHRGELIFCCDVNADKGVIGSINDYSLPILLEKRLSLSAALKKQRVRMISQGQMGEGFDTCQFCNHYFLDAN
jgi:MoaA/NifB/PqqE/SkfB family radical SAM enzyme